MQYSKTKAAAVVIAASVLTACTSTAAPSATPIKTVEVPVMPPVPSELLATHERPARPAGGSPEQLLTHAVAYSGYCQKLEAQAAGWQAWYQRGQKQP